MAIASVDTRTLLNAWQRRMTSPIYLFNQATGDGVYAPLSAPGLGIYVQPEREGVAEGLITALAITDDYLHFAHRPIYVTERVPINPLVPFWQQTLSLRWKHLQAIGKRGVELIDAAAPIVYRDDDGDGVLDTATITVTTDAPLSEIQLFFEGVTFFPIQADPRLQIEPAQVTAGSVAGTVEIRAHRALFVKPSIWGMPYREPNYNQASKNYAVTTDPDDFIETVGVYRVYPDPVGAVRLIGKPRMKCCAGDGASYQDAPVYPLNGATIEDSRLSFVNVSYCNLPCGWHEIEAIEIDYYAGYPLDPFTRLPNRALETAIIRLANAEMPNTPCQFDDERLRVWIEDTRQIPEGGVNQQMADNPFGLKMGHLNAWKVLSRYRVGVGGAIISGGGHYVQ